MMGSQLYICGGSRFQNGDASPAFKELLEVDYLGGVLRLASMHFGRQRLSLAANPYLDVLAATGGGQNSMKTLKSAEVYHRKRNKWEQKPDFNSKRSEHSSIIFCQKDKRFSLYIFGGTKGKDNRSDVIKTVEKLDIEQSKAAWIEVNSQGKSTTDANKIIFQKSQEEIVVFGGIDQLSFIIIRMIPPLQKKKEQHTRQDVNSNIHFKTLHNSTIGGFFKNEFYTIGSRNPDEWALLKWTDKEVKDGIFQEVAVLEKFDNDFLSSHFYK